MSNRDSDPAATQEPPKIVFPCQDYPVKVMGDAGMDFHSHVVSVFQRHAPGYDETKVTIRDSRNGRFQSITVFITATGKLQLQQIFTDLKTSPLIKMVL